MTTAATVATRAEGEAVGHFVTLYSGKTSGALGGLWTHRRGSGHSRQLSWASSSQPRNSLISPHLSYCSKALSLTSPFVLHVPNQQIPRWADSHRENKRSLFLTLAFCLFHKPSCLTDGSGAYQSWWKWKGEIVSFDSKEMFSLALLPLLESDSKQQPQKPHPLYWLWKDLSFLNSN